MKKRRGRRRKNEKKEEKEPETERERKRNPCKFTSTFLLTQYIHAKSIIKGKYGAKKKHRCTIHTVRERHEKTFIQFMKRKCFTVQINRGQMQQQVLREGRIEREATVIITHV